PTLGFPRFTNAHLRAGTVYFRTGASGGFTVTPASTDDESGVASYAYPALGSGWTRSGGDYSFDASAVDPTEPNNLHAVNGASLVGADTSFPVAADGAAPVSSIACDGAACSNGWDTGGPVSVALSAAENSS